MLEPRIEAYLRQQRLTAEVHRVVALTGDASDRRYFRVHFADRPSIVLALHAGPIDVELHLQHAHPNEPNRLTVHVLFRPSHPRLLADKNWRARCSQVFVELRAYLMGRESG